MQYLFKAFDIFTFGLLFCVFFNELHIFLYLCKLILLM